MHVTHTPTSCTLTSAVLRKSCQWFSAFQAMSVDPRNCLVKQITDALNKKTTVGVEITGTLRIPPNMIVVYGIALCENEMLNFIAVVFLCCGVWGRYRESSRYFVIVGSDGTVKPEYNENPPKTSLQAAFHYTQFQVEKFAKEMHKLNKRKTKRRAHTKHLSSGEKLRYYCNTNHMDTLEAFYHRRHVPYKIQIDNKCLSMR